MASPIQPTPPLSEDDSEELLRTLAENDAKITPEEMDRRTVAASRILAEMMGKPHPLG